MKDGFIKVAAGVPQVAVADVCANTENIKKLISEADRQNINLLILPELCITGYTCGDLFFSEALLEKAIDSLCRITAFTKDKYTVTAVGLPLKYRSKLYNCAAVLYGGKILGIVPKTYIPCHNGSNEKRQFCSGKSLNADACININGKLIPFGTDLLFEHSSIEDYKIGIEICEDLEVAEQPSISLALGGAAVIGNLSASNELIGKAEYRNTLLSSTSKRLICGYIYSSSSVGESTQDTVYSGHCAVYENGTLLAENKPFEGKKLTVTEIDLKTLSHMRCSNSSFISSDILRGVSFNQEIISTEITRKIEKNPFVPENITTQTAETVLQIQSNGLARRLSHTHSKKAVIGVSGGLDSTLALLVAVRAMKLLNRPLTDILAITMPCFGTTKRTRSNSEVLCRQLGVDFKEINITDAVKQHFADINQSETEFDVTFENSQARERTQVLMDIANQQNGLVIGTGDLSELALGWATYNGDHMSMYGVNASVPKTLIRYIVEYEAMRSETELKEVLLDILGTPVSPELLPAKLCGEIAQKTEDLVGPYELHDFFLYHTVRLCESPKKIFRLAVIAFCEYKPETIHHWLNVFTRRFFTQQFKRSCLPDGPKVGSLSLSPRGDWQMPTDASYNLWLKELEEIKP